MIIKSQAPRERGLANTRKKETMSQKIELGLDTFGDVTAGSDGQLLPQAQVIRDVVEEAALADEVGVHAIGLGEHHRADFAISSPDVVLAAIATRTKRILLASAVTVLSSDDPIRVFQRFSTLDAISGGRAEVILGRGSSPSPFRCSVTISPITRRCLTKSSICLRRSSRTNQSLGRAKRAHRSPISVSFRRSKTVRSKPGSASAAARNPSFARRSMTCR